MTVTVKALVGAKYAENSQTTQYTAPSGTRTIVDKCTGTNNSGATATRAFNVVTAAASAATANVVVSKPLAVGETYVFPEVVGQILNPGDFISTLASAASAITIRLSGREES